MPNDYRLFAGAFLEGELASCIQALRQHYDPVTARITPPHVTLAGVYGRRGKPVAESEAPAIARLEKVIQTVLPFELRFGGLRTFPTGDCPVIHLAVELTPDLLAARQALLEALGRDQPRQYVPHLTLAMRLGGSAAQAMLDELRGGEWDISNFVVEITKFRLMQRAPSDPAWRCIAIFPLSIL